MGMHGLILIEGADRQGKTTLATRLAERHGAAIYHCGYRFRDRIFAYHAAVLRRAVAESCHRLVVIDRHWLSEAVYGNVYRGGTRWPHQGRMVDRVLRRWATLTVIAATDPGHASAVEHDQELGHTSDHARRVCEQYLALVHHWPERLTQHEGYLRTLVQGHDRRDLQHYDYRDFVGDAIDGAVDGILHRLDELQQGQAPVRDVAFDPYNLNFLGSVSGARVVMVGDRTNAKNDKVAWPFFEYGNSSLYLARACHAADLDETRLVWINAHDDSARETLFKLLALGLGTVALGREASARLKLWGVRHTDVRHPQAARRFSYADVGGYARELHAAVRVAGS